MDGKIEQLQPIDTLIESDVKDVLDEGYSLPDEENKALRYGNTPAEMRRGESLKRRLKQEEPETDPDALDGDWNPLYEEREVGHARAGRIVYDEGAYGRDVGVSGGAISAEEAAMHVITEDSPLDD